MAKKLKVLMIGAHFDDNDFRSSGTALNYVKLGHEVKFLSITDGRCGHHELKPVELIARRKKEAQAVADLMGITYDCFDIPDCEVVADLETRKRLINYIRRYAPDVIFTHRTNDYHTDHRNTALLVQDSAYLLTVPNFCPETPAMATMPVILFYYDNFTNPPFKADVIVATDELIDLKYQIYNLHESQVYEWMPYNDGYLHLVPSDKAKRIDWFRSPLVPRDTPLTPEELLKYKTKWRSEYTEAISASKFRDLLIKRYGERGKKIIFAESFAVSEYGAPLTKEKEAELFPF